MSNITLTDLRLNNYIKRGKAIYIVDAISRYGINATNLNNKSSSILNKGYSGIPITEEWLHKLGFYILPFEQYTTYEHTIMALVRLEEDMDGHWIQIHHLNNHDEEEYVNCGGFEFVHDLQNCFYFLTGTELTLR